MARDYTEEKVTEEDLEEARKAANAARDELAKEIELKVSLFRKSLLPLLEAADAAVCATIKEAPALYTHRHAARASGDEDAEFLFQNTLLTSLTKPSE